MAVTPTLFKVRFSEFSSITDERIQLFIDDAVIVLNETQWGTKYDLGVSYLAAHYLILGEDSSNGNPASDGPISGKSVDGTSISYSNATAKDQWETFLSSTKYGQRYLALLKTLGVVAFVV